MGSACLLTGVSGMTVEVQSPHKWIRHDGGGISIGRLYIIMYVGSPVGSIARLRYRQ
jgi:hypothetical protein